MSDKNAQKHFFSWEIQNFSFFSFRKNGDSINSPIFTVNAFGGSQWYLELYPSGYKKEHDGFVSVFLQKEKNDAFSPESIVRFSIVMIGGDGRTLEVLDSKKYMFRENLAYGWNKLTKISKLVEAIGNWEEDTLTIRCYMCQENAQSGPSESKAHTEILLDQCRFLWNVEISDDFSETVSKELSFSKNSLYEMSLKVFFNEIRIRIKQKIEKSACSKLVYGKISLLDSKGQEINSESASYLFETNSKNLIWEFPVIYVRKFLHRNKNTFLHDRTISLLCKFVAPSGKLLSKMLGPNTENEIELNETRIHLALVSELKSMLLNNVHPDVQLKATDEIIHAHKSILASRSPVFAAMFRQDMLETKTSTVDISDIEGGTLKLFLVFIYTGTIDKFDYNKAKELILLADRYEVPTLTEKCAAFLQSVLSVGNVCELLSLAHMINHKELKNTAINFIVRNSEIVFSLTEWSVLVESNAKLAIEVLPEIASFKK